VEVRQYSGGSDADEHTSVLADSLAGGRAVDYFWYHDRSADRDEPGTLQVTLPGVPKERGEPDLYELRFEAPDVGAMLAAAKPADVEAVMTTFLGQATPEVLGVIVGRVIAHLARGRTAES
jgi:hypothetical protein